MDHIDKVLATNCDSYWFSLPIHAALVVGKNTMNRYYNKTDQSEVYRIAMSMYSLYSCNTVVLISIEQFFTRDTSFLTSGTKIGKTFGSRLPTMLPARSSTARITQQMATPTLTPRFPLIL
jgi:hypothetical protein